ncbi:MAG: ABC transporter ATP-binding protein [Thermoguttaceae bacterium]|jgi:ABC-2 type transport system ATP-binding protein
MIEFDAVRRTFGRKVAVDGLSLTIGAGEIVALLGSNGAGKTTAIRMAVGLLRPDAGRVRVCGHDVVAATQEATRLIGYVPEEAFLYDKLTGREFLEFAAELRGLDRNLVRTRIARENDRFDLGEFLDELMETYSHGMKQRLVFASALLHDPRVLVLDEPMVGLDPRSVRVVKDLLRAEAGRGTAVLMSTHTLAVAEEIAHRIGIVDQGRLAFLGTLAQLRQELSSPQAALEPLFLELTEGPSNVEQVVKVANDGSPSPSGRGGP